MTTYAPIETKASTDTPTGNEQRIYEFANGYGASVVCGVFTYGGPSGFFELAVLGPDGHLNYKTPITDDVLGWLTEDEVQATLANIDALPAVTA